MEIDREELAFANTTKPSSGSTYAPYSKIIHMGERNKTLSVFASRILKKYGNTDKTMQLFLQRADDCEQPLGEDELRTIWNSAVGFYNRAVLTDPNYKAPDEYNNDFRQFLLKA